MENERNEKRDLARAKLESRRARVRGIRRKVAVLAASLAVAFSGVILTRTAVQEFSGQNQEQTSSATGKDPGVQETLGATVVSAATGLVFEGDDEDEDDEEGSEGGIGSFFNSSSSTPAESSQS